jgi:hypothetical protein
MLGEYSVTYREALADAADTLRSVAEADFQGHLINSADCLQAALDALKAHGWFLTRYTPTEAMTTAGAAEEWPTPDIYGDIDEDRRRGTIDYIYNAMIKAAQADME